jgi:gamma-glutamylaminecyclotransferase
MCVIIIKQKNNMMSEQIAKTSSKINPHGLGIIWLDTFEVTYHKSKEYKLLLTDRPFIAHFRYATKGAVNLANTHPFVCGSNTDEMLMHNGTIKGLGSKDMCDSKELAIQLGSINRADWKARLEQYDSRFVSVNLRTRSFQIYNRNLYTYRDGIWYSKTDVLQDNLIAVYGTLKKGLSNYHSYLSNEIYIGEGKTQDRYPLIVNGLPFLVDKKGVGHNVIVDVFKVSDAQLQKIDRLEGHPQWYRRVEVPIKLEGRTLNCWVYFNPRDITEGTEMLNEYVERQRGDYSLNYYDTNESHSAIDIGWDDDDIYTTGALACIDCFNDVQHDLFQNYYCSSCGGWFKEDEILIFNNK